MQTDWVLFRRAAHELDERLRGAKVRDAGLLPDGRIGIVLRSHGHDAVLAVDAFGSPPLPTLETGELGIAAEPGFVRALASALRGMTFARAQARKGDRVLRVDFAARSRFGVGDALELYLELVPRFGNLVLVKNGTTVAAAKEFSLAENGTRAIAAGLPYELPPARAGSLVPKIVESSGSSGDAFLEFAQSDALLREPLHVYRHGGELVAAHVVPLPQFAQAEHSRQASLLDLFAEMRGARVRSGESAGVERRRAGLVRKLDAREARLRGELRGLDAKRHEAAARETLRADGEGIYASLHELSDGARDEAKDRATKLFARYKKLGSALPHIDARDAALRAALDAVEALRWEAERAAPEDLDDVESAISALERRRTSPAIAAKKRRRAPLELRTPSGSRIVIGRSPVENADVTFRIARPNDLWFHAKDIPGAHVVLARDDRGEPPQEDVERAASVAAFYSKAKHSAKVAVDYTLRKHVRKQQNAPPGLVWYTHPKTLLVAPAEVTP